MIHIIPEKLARADCYGQFSRWLITALRGASRAGRPDAKAIVGQAPGRVPARK